MAEQRALEMQVLEFFFSLDTDGNGILSAQEVWKAVKNGAFVTLPGFENLTTAQTMKKFDNVDVDLRITQEEFFNTIYRLKAEALYEKKLFQSIERFWRSIDRNGDGHTCPFFSKNLRPLCDRSIVCLFVLVR
jgi:hypothetical protein